MEKFSSLNVGDQFQSTTTISSDELDEYYDGINTTTYIWDLNSLISKGTLFISYRKSSL